MYISRKNKYSSITFEREIGDNVRITSKTLSDNGYLSMCLSKEDALSMAEELVRELVGSTVQKDAFIVNVNESVSEQEIAETVAGALKEAAQHDYNMAIKYGTVEYTSVLRKGLRRSHQIQSLNRLNHDIESIKSDLRDKVVSLVTTLKIRSMFEEQDARSEKLKEMRARVMKESGYCHDQYDMLTVTTKKLIDRVIEAEGLV